MEWEGHEESSNVEDRRGMPVKAGLAIGGGGIVVVLLALLFGVDPSQLGLGGGGGQAPPAKRALDPQEERMAKFTKVVLKDTEVVWQKLFAEMNPPRKYKYPGLVLFTDQVATACGRAGSSVGPFYCPADEKVYIDLSFYKDMENKLRAPGEFARAYVIAHEVGHHVQRLLGYSQRVDEARGTRLENQMSVRLELQADYLAGVWGYYAKNKFKLRESDLESALKAALEIGDDRLQKKGRGYVVPEQFQHGTSEQRMRWFRRGFETGNASRKALDQLFDLPYDRL
jgi:predicted metalloprotease